MSETLCGNHRTVMSRKCPSTKRHTFKSEEKRKCTTQLYLCSNKMEGKLQLYVLMLHLHVSLAVGKSMTVMKGQTLNLHCPIKSQGHNHPVEWKNPDGQRDKRISLYKLTESEFSIRISNVTFSDGGRYKCSHYLHHAVEKTVEVTVLDRPQMDFITDKEWTVIKCSAEGNYPPPEISWQIKKAPEFRHNNVQIIQEDKKYRTINMLLIKTAEKAISVKCIVRHPALHSRTLIDFVRTRPAKNRNNRPETKTSLPETTPSPATTGELITDQFPTTEKVALPTEFSSTIPQFSTGIKNPTKTTSGLPEATTKQKTLLTTGELTSDRFPTTEKEGLSTEFSTTIPQFNTEASTVDSTTERSVILNTTSNSDLPANISFNETKNTTESGNGVERKTEPERSAVLLVFLITCLMFGLLVVVIFIGIKLRRAHIIWKRENDDTDTSEASSKSKSSQEDKNTQRRRGFFNTRLTQYVIQEPTVITSVTNPATVTSPEPMTIEQNSPAQLPPLATPKSNIKETEL